MLYLQSSQDQNKSEIDLNDHLHVILTKYSDNLTQYKKNCGGHEDRQGGAKERPPKANLHNNTRSSFKQTLADIHSLHNMQGKYLWSRVRY